MSHNIFSPLYLFAKEDKETWWWDEEVQESIRKKILAKKRWDIQRDEESKQEYKEMRREAKKEVAKAKSKAYDELYEGLDTKEGENTLYRLARQRHQAGKDVQQVRMMKDKDGNVMTDEESVLRMWKEYYMFVNERQDNSSGTVKMQGEEVAKVEDFKYLGSTVQSNGECGRELKKRVQAGWNGWRRMSGVICDRRVPAEVKGKVYKVAVRPAMLYGLETVALTKRQEAEMEVAELKMLRFSLGVTRMDKIRNEYIRGTAQVGKFGEKTREARRRWYGHLRRKDDGYIGRRMLRMELPGKRKRGRPKRRFMDVVKEDMVEVEVTEEDTVDRRNWRKKIRCGDP